MSFSSTSLILAWILGITMMEFYLPSGPSSWFDVAGAAGFLALVGLTWAGVETSAVAVGPRARKGWEYLRSIVSKYHIKLGVDFRETPPYPQRVPAPFMWLTLVVAALAILGLTAPSVFPHGLRSQLAGRSSTLYLAITSATWLWASAVGSFSGFIFWYYLNDALVGSGAPSRLGRRLRILVPLAALIAVVFAATIIDPSVPVAAIVGILMLGLLSLAFGRTGQIKLVWRVVGATQVFAVGFRWIIAWSGVLCCGVVSATCILMTISGWHGGPAGPTVWIGSATAWLGVLAAATWLWASPIRLLSLALHDPERVRPTAVLFTDRVPSPQVVADLEARGIRVLEQEGDGSLVRVTLDPEANRRQVEAVVSGDDPIWSVHPDDLLTPDVLAELRAIDRSTRRQQLIIGVGRLMALAKTRKFKEGTGFWFAPHLWYIRSMSRDSDETDSESVGPPYHRLLSAAARHYCHEVFRAASVDLVFIEDGVALEGVERVLVQLFDHYDIWGAEPIQERHFQAVPLVQIMIHDVTHDSHLDREGYPEPDYDEIGRARILHIMRDRGGEDEESSDALDPTHEPLVAGIV